MLFDTFPNWYLNIAPCGRNKIFPNEALSTAVHLP